MKRYRDSMRKGAIQLWATLILWSVTLECYALPSNYYNSWASPPDPNNPYYMLLMKAAQLVGTLFCIFALIDLKNIYHPRSRSTYGGVFWRFFAGVAIFHIDVTLSIAKHTALAG